MTTNNVPTNNSIASTGGKYNMATSLSQFRSERNSQIINSQ